MAAEGAPNTVPSQPQGNYSGESLTSTSDQRPTCLWHPSMKAAGYCAECDTPACSPCLRSSEAGGGLMVCHDCYANPSRPFIGTWTCGILVTLLVCLTPMLIIVMLSLRVVGQADRMEAERLDALDQQIAGSSLKIASILGAAYWVVVFPRCRRLRKKRAPTTLSTKSSVLDL